MESTKAKLVEVDASPGDRDDDVLRMVDAGDHIAALRTLMQRYGTPVYRYCREALRDATLADDVHQQIFIQAHRDLSRFARRSALRTWLYAIARHRVLDAAKSRRRASARLVRDEAADAVDPKPAPGDRIDDARLRRALAGCIEELGEHVRTALLLRYQQGFSYEEMAEMCSEKPGTLEARIRRALPTLRECIETRTGGKL